MCLDKTAHKYIYTMKGETGGGEEGKGERRRRRGSIKCEATRVG